MAGGIWRRCKHRGNNWPPILIDCICNDARWDRQAESRDEYYASLVMDTQVDISPIADFLKANDDTNDDGEVLCIIYILGQLAIRKHASAISLLCVYVGYGHNWCEAVSQIVGANDDKYYQKLDAVICRRYPNDSDLLKELDRQYLDDGFLKFLSESSLRLRKLLDSPEVKGWMPGKEGETPLSEPDYSALTIREIFERCDLRNYVKLSRILKEKLRPVDLPFLETMVLSEYDSQKALALRCIGMIGTKQSFAVLKKHLEKVSAGFLKNPEYEKFFLCRASLMNVAEAPAEICLETGRRWFASDNCPVCVAGREILEKYAAVDDIPVLRQAILQSLNDDEGRSYKLCSAVRALNKFSDRGMFPEVERVYHETIYSCARRDAVETMVNNAPDEFAIKYAYECLFDCEQYTKLAGIGSISLNNPDAYSRLKQLSEDSLETEDIRRKAAERLCQLKP